MRVCTHDGPHRYADGCSVTGNFDSANFHSHIGDLDCGEVNMVENVRAHGLLALLEGAWSTSEVKAS